MGLVLPRLAPLQVYLGLSHAPHCSFVTVSFEDPASACGGVPRLAEGCGTLADPRLPKQLAKTCKEKQKKGSEAPAGSHGWRHCCR